MNLVAANLTTLNVTHVLGVSSNRLNHTLRGIPWPESKIAPTVPWRECGKGMRMNHDGDRYSALDTVRLAVLQRFTATLAYLPRDKRRHVVWDAMNDRAVTAAIRGEPYWLVVSHDFKEAGAVNHLSSIHDIEPAYRVSMTAAAQSVLPRLMHLAQEDTP